MSDFKVVIIMKHNLKVPAMKKSALSHRLFLLVLPFLFTGCYTQFQTYDEFPVGDREYASYYSWDEYEGASEQIAEEREKERALQNEVALQEMGIYFQDYETKRWYEDHYADKLYWKGYRDGYDDGYFDGWTGNYDYRFNRYRYHYYSGAFNHFNYYRQPRFHASFWFGHGGFPYYSGYYVSYYSPWGGFHDPYYGGYWVHPYYSYNYYYNSYKWKKKYRREADLYRKGPRNSGLVNRGDYRTRSGYTSGSNDNVRTRGTNVLRSRSTNNGVRVRGSNSGSVGRSSSGTVGRSRGSSVGKDRNSSGTRTRSSGSSVGKRSSDGKSGKSRSRDNFSSNFGQTSVRDINVTGYQTGTTYTIPPRKVGVNRGSRSSYRSFSLGDLFRRSTYSNSNSSFKSRSTFNSRFESSSSSSRTSRSINRGSSRSSNTKVTRSSSSSRSSGTKSRGSSSSSKRSRGNN